MTENIVIQYQTVRGVPRRVVYQPRGGSTHWSMTTYEKENGEWEPRGSTEVKHPRVVNDDRP